MKIRPKVRENLIFLSFLIVDLFAAVEVTAMIIAAPKVAEYFGLSRSFFSIIVNSYLYVSTLSLVIFFLLYRKISQKGNGKKFFLEGLIYFSIGSAVCFFSNSFLLFIFGRILQGFGAGMSFVGQLWVITESYKEKITKPLFWTELGFASGIIIGPLVGGFLADLYPGSWRLIFLINFFICAAGAVLMGLFYQKNGQEPDKNDKKVSLFSFPRIFYIAIICEAVVTVVAFALEFLISTYIQEVKEYPPYLAGFLILCGSLGIISGSGFLIEKHPSRYPRYIQNGLQGMIMSIIIMGIFLHFDLIYGVAFSLFFVGFFMGLLGVATYALVSHSLSAERMVKGILVYLLVLEAASAAGIQMEDFFILIKGNFLLLTALLVVILHVGLFFSMRMKTEKAVII